MSRFDDAATKSADHKTACASVLLAGTFMLGCAGSAQAGNWDNWKEFRNLNPGINGRALRSLYRDQYGTGTAGGGSGNPPLANILPIYPSSAGANNLPVISVLNSTAIGAETATKFRNSRSFQTQEGRLVGMGSGADIDLASSAKNIRLGNKLFNGADSVKITVGDTVKTFTVGSEVTAAEYVAAKQVIAGHGQSLQLDNNGKAIGGAVDFASITFKNDRMNIDDLNIPANVTAVGDFSKNPTFSVSGDLTNAGSIYAYSSGEHARRSNFSADNVINKEGALITTDLPTVYAMPSFTGGSKPTDLNIRGNDTVRNYGTISASGDLNISAGNLVENGAGGTVYARGDVGVSAARIENSGLVRSVNGSVTLDGPYNGELNVVNTGGTVMAREGAINIRNDQYGGPSNTYVTGGNFYSKEVNVNAGRGSAEIDVDDLTGTLNQKGFASHVAAKTEVLSLGNICLTGDPTYSNTGDIVINGDITVNEALNIIATGDISNSTDVTLTANNGTQGFAVTVIAGAAITAGGGTDGNIGPIPPLVAGTTTTISGAASASGGNILFGENGAVNINTRSAGKTGNGGDVQLAAFRSAGDANGNIVFSAGSITTGGKGTGTTNGNVDIIAGAVSGTNVIANIDTTGGTSAGDISFISAQPTAGAAITFNADGSRTGGPLTSGVLPANPAPLVVAGALKAQNTIDITVSGGNLSWLSDSKFGITTLNKTNGQVNLDADNIAVGNGNFFSTPILRVLLGTGDLGQAGVVALQTDATNIRAVGNMATSEIVIVSYNKGLVLYSGSAQNINFSSAGTFMSNPSFAPITGDTVLIGSFSAGTGLNALNPVEVDATNLFITAGKKGDVFGHNSHVGDWTLLDTTTMVAKTTFSLTSDSDMKMLPTAVISAANVILSTDTQFDGLNGTINGSASVTLTSDLTMTTSGIPATINTARLNLNSLSGSIGTAATPGNRYLINTGVASINARSSTGDVFLLGQSTGKSFEVAGGSAAGDFDYSGTGSLVISGILGTGGDANFVIDTGTLSTKAAIINSGEDILLQIADNVSTKIKISLGANTTLQTFASPANGDIVLALGTPITQVAGTPPTKGVVFQTFSAGQIFWGAGVTGKGNNSVLAKAADVTFSNAISSKNISLGGNVIIYADPPSESEFISSASSAAGFATVSSAALSAPPGELKVDFGAESSRQLAKLPFNSMPFSTVLDTSSASATDTVGGADATLSSALKLSPSLSTLQQSQLNLITAEQATLADSLYDGDDSVCLSRNPSAQFYAGNICAEDGVYNAITSGGEEASPILAGVAKTVLSDRVNAPEGKTLFMPTTDMTVATRFGDIRVDGGAVVIVSNTPSGIAVYNVHDTAKNSVSIDVRGRKMSLCPGRHLMVTDDRGTDFSSVNHVESIMHRGIVSNSIDSDLKVHTSEFSTLSAMAGILPLRAVFESKHPHSKKIADKMLKTTACLMYLSGNQGEFQYFVKPRMTALR
jgi:hypothetical protein